MTSFSSLLIANRGEIALRIMRTARDQGLRCIAVYSAADAGAPHVQFADDAVLIGPPPVGESYLDMARVLAAAQETGAEAVHPGYGFLAENADFARACADAGLVFVGPGVEAIVLMGNKAAAKRRMIAANVLCVPGYEGEDQSDQAMIAAAAQLGYPIMVKAAAGGGGRGMRLVDDAAGLPQALEAARSEALNAFGSGELILEKAILRPRHVEIQVFADNHGNVIHLGERDCSVQRRHQKVVEEAPCPIMTEDLRARMGAAAVEAARNIDYRGAGTVEFLLDGEGTFYFLEMNTRLQVEHPVTEMITGLDLVALQIKVAQGAPLGLEQADVQLRGHAIEVRLYAEDPAQGFLPATGPIELWQPASREGFRVDDGIVSGQEVSPYYDPMLAKLVAWGETRDIARKRLISGLTESIFFGPASNQRFLIDVLRRDAFAEGRATTAFISEEFSDEALQPPALNLEIAAMAAVLQYRLERQAAFKTTVRLSPALLEWNNAGQLATRYVYGGGDGQEDEEFDVTVSPMGGDRYQVRHGETELQLELLEINAPRATVAVAGRRHMIGFLSPGPGRIMLAIDGATYRLRNAIAVAGVAEEAAGGGRVVAPMHGALLEILVEAGATVTKGTRLAVLEAMKMQHDILAEVDGIVREIFVSAGMQVAADDVLIEIEEDAA